MFEIHPGSWPVTFDAGDPRNDFHRTALAEARVTTDRLGVAARDAQTRPDLATRVRLALAGGSRPTADPCTCPA